MKYYVALLLFTVALTAEPKYDPPSCAMKVETTSEISFDFGIDIGTKKIYYKPENTIEDLQCRTLEGNKKSICEKLYIDKPQKIDLFLQDSDNDPNAIKLGLPLRIVEGQGVFNVSNSSIIPKTETSVDFTLLLQRETGDEKKIGYKNGTENILLLLVLRWSTMSLAR